MAAYAISGVRYDIDKARVQRIRVHVLSANELGPPVEMSREELVEALQVGVGFMVLHDDGPAPVAEPTGIRLVRLGSESYVRCDSQPWPVDDVFEVPEY